MAAIPPFSQKSLKAQVNSIGSPLIFQGFSCDGKMSTGVIVQEYIEQMWNYCCAREKSTCLENIHWVEMLRFRASHLPLATHSWKSKGAPWSPQAWWCLMPRLPCAVSASEWAPVLGKQFSLGGLLQPEPSSVVVWRDENVGLLGFKWRLSTNLNWFDGFTPFDWIS